MGGLWLSVLYVTTALAAAPATSTSPAPVPSATVPAPPAAGPMPGATVPVPPVAGPGPRATSPVPGAGPRAGKPLSPADCFRERQDGACVPICQQFVQAATCDRHPPATGKLRPIRPGG